MLGLCVKNIHYTLGRCHSVLCRVGKICKEVHRLVEHSGVGYKGNEKSDGNTAAADNEVSAHRPDNHASKAHQTADDGGKGVTELVRIYVVLVPFVVAVCKIFGCVFFIGKGFHHSDTRQSIGKRRGYSRAATPDPAVYGSYLFLENTRCYSHKRYGEEREKRELPVDTKHYHNYAYHFE